MRNSYLARAGISNPVEFCKSALEHGLIRAPAKEQNSHNGYHLRAPRSGEIPLKQWVHQKAAEFGITPRAVYGRIYRGKLKTPPLRRVNSIVVYVKLALLIALAAPCVGWIIPGLPLIPVRPPKTTTTNLTLAWNGPPNATGYRLSWWTNGGAATTIATAAPRATATNLSRRNTYYFSVKATNSAGESAASNTIQYPTPVTNYLTVRAFVWKAASLTGPWLVDTQWTAATFIAPTGSAFFRTSINISNAVK
jgi:hypothetical protein